MKKFTLILIVVSAMSILSGCGSSEPAAEPEAPAETGGTSSTPMNTDGAVQKETRNADDLK
jgi:major membrane immunogen (membrane-anchored lipoprotein)